MSVERIGRYQIEETLGRGAMGVVYRARDPIIDRQVALKTLRVDLDAEHADEFRARFVREAQAAGRLNHPGIVTVHDVGEDPESGLVYIAMEYVEGRDLKQVLASGRRFRPSEAARIAADVATALDYAHSLGVVHRDIKPANIILTPDGTAKITDFGIARLETSNLTVDGQFIGTPNFMSPEQITGKAVDGRSDIFSLGVVLFNLLTEKRPFNGGTMHEVTLRIVQEPCPIPSTLSDHIPPAFNPVILKCLEKNPDRRFQTGAEVARVLAALARSLVDREPTDDLSTGVFQPDLETRIHAGDDRQAPPPADAISRVRQWLSERLPRVPALRLPDALRRDVEPRWVATIIAATLVLALIPIFGLRSRIDRGPFSGPTPGATKNLHGVVASLHAARTRVRQGDLAAAETAVLAALDQAPSSPAARRLAAKIRGGLEQARTSAENQQRVSQLVSDGRSAYRRGDYAAAGELFRQALDLDPVHEIAASYLELTEERARSVRPARNAAVTSTADPNPAPARPLPRAPVKSGVSRITVTFDSPISEGSVAVTLDGELLADVPFDFSTDAFLGIKKKGRGTVRRVILTPSGSHTIGVELRESKRGVLGLSEFVRELEPDSEWTLRVDLPAEKAQPNFFLVKSAR
jgi:serine/threonine protein kinase